MRNLLAEVLVLDFLVKSGFVNIAKISRKDKPHIDISAEKDGRIYAIDATRKQEITNWEAEPGTNLEDCASQKNQLKIRRLIMQALEDKDEQLCRAINARTIFDSSVKFVAIKTSDYGFAECIEQAAKVAQELLSENDRWRFTDCIWLLPNVDVSQSRWIYKHGAG